MDADDHAFVDVGVRADEQAPPLLQVEQSVGHRLAGCHGYQRTVVPPPEIAGGARSIVVEGVIDQAGAPR